jgi:hypothetical protein
MNYKDLLKEVKNFVLDYYNAGDLSKLIYHNKRHIADAAAAAEKICVHYELDDHEYFIVMASIWLHDIGYLTHTKGHEEEGSRIAAELLKKLQLEQGDIELIRSCIMSTRIPQSAETLPEQIVCDADLFHLGTDNFFKNDKLLLKEFNAQNNTELDKLEWRKKTIVFIQNHFFFTDYCRLLLDDKKDRNIRELQDKINKGDLEKSGQKSEEPETEAMISGPAATSKAEKKGKKNKDRPDKGIETMFRVSSGNHQRLSDMADKKAHIMITVNSIILSAIISLVLRRLDTYGYLIGPSLILLTVSLIAMTFSILSTRPSIPRGTFTPEQLAEKKVNLLFFGNFYKMQYGDFNNGMLKMMQDSEFLYGSLIRDLYAQGVVLGKKYQFLRIAYNVFMFGLIIAVVAFILASVYLNHHVPVSPPVPEPK